ncbi:hypothetical protein ACHAXS_011036 [Conticribra weissflogii]
MNFFPSRTTLRRLTNNDNLAASFLLLVLGNNLSQVRSHAFDRPSIEDHAMGALCMKEPIYTLSFPSNLTDSIYSTVSMNQPINATLFPLPSVEANSLPSDSGSLNWYPDWGNTETCRNDGKEPSYMSNNPTFITNSKEDCCNNVSFSNDLAFCNV